MSGEDQNLSARPLSAVAERIRRLVDDTPGMTQTKLARRMDRGLSSVNARLTGETDIKVDELPLFAKALGVPVASLFEDDETREAQARVLPPSVAVLEDVLGSLFLEAIQEARAKLSPRNQRMADMGLELFAYALDEAS